MGSRSDGTYVGSFAIERLLPALAKLVRPRRLVLIGGTCLGFSTAAEIALAFQLSFLAVSGGTRRITLSAPTLKLLCGSSASSLTDLAVDVCDADVLDYVRSNFRVLQVLTLNACGFSSFAFSTAFLAQVIALARMPTLSALRLTAWAQDFTGPTCEALTEHVRDLHRETGKTVVTIHLRPWPV